MPKHNKMTLEHRAKQFLPFTALPELEIAIEEKNREYYKKLEEENDYSKIRNLDNFVNEMNQLGDTKIQITYNNPTEIIVAGTFNGFDPETKTILIGNQNILIDDIEEIRII